MHATCAMLGARPFLLANLLQPKVAQYWATFFDFLLLINIDLRTYFARVRWHGFELFPNVSHDVLVAFMIFFHFDGV